MLVHFWGILIWDILPRCNRVYIHIYQNCYIQQRNSHIIFAWRQYLFKMCTDITNHIQDSQVGRRTGIQNSLNPFNAQSTSSWAVGGICPVLVCLDHPTESCPLRWLQPTSPLAILLSFHWLNSTPCILRWGFPKSRSDLYEGRICPPNASSGVK